MGAYKDALMTRALTGGVADIADALTDFQRTKLMQQNQAQEQERFGLLKEEAKREKIKFESDYGAIPVDTIRSSLEQRFGPLGKRTLAFFNSKFEPHTFDVGGVKSIYPIRGREVVNDFENKPEEHVSLLSDIQADLQDNISQLEEMQKNPELMKGNKPENVQAQLDMARQRLTSVTKELSLNPHYQSKVKAEIEAQKEKEKETAKQQMIADYASKYPDVAGMSQTLMAMPYDDAVKQINTIVTGATTAKKIPIQSDKIQAAMAELGIDITNPDNYTPENISRGVARMRKLEAEERRSRNEELTANQRALIGHGLRTELRQNQYVKDFQDIDNKYSVMEAAWKKAKSHPESYVAVDQALITLYNKMTDPTSVVRESEYARTAENQSVVSALLGKMDKWRQGGAGLTDIERKALVEMGKEFYNKYLENYNQVIGDYEQTAKESGISPTAIGVPFRKKSPKSNAPTLKEWLAEARKANPNTPEQDLINYYNKKYGGK